MSPTPSPYGTMVKEYQWWSIRMRRCTSQLSFLATCSPPATMMMMRKRWQVRRAIFTSLLVVAEVSSERWILTSAMLTVYLVPGGRNGYGAKLCNIFSTKFTVETACKEYRHSFKQVRMTLLLKILHRANRLYSVLIWINTAIPIACHKEDVCFLGKS